MYQFKSLMGYLLRNQPFTPTFFLIGHINFSYNICMTYASLMFFIKVGVINDIECDLILNEL